MADFIKPEPRTDAELDDVQGGGLLLPAVQAAREGKGAVLYFDEADAVQRTDGAKGYYDGAGNHVRASK